MDLPQLVPPMFREECRCALMEHMEQSVMWAGTNWMLRLLAVNLATTQQVSVGRPLVRWLLKQGHDIASYLLCRITSIERFKLWSLVWPCLSGECDV